MKHHLPVSTTQGNQSGQQPALWLLLKQMLQG
jgi:hypothetical protein